MTAQGTASPLSPPPTPSMVTFVPLRQRDPAMFSGRPGEDPEEWLKGYNRIAVTISAMTA